MKYKIETRNLTKIYKKKENSNFLRKIIKPKYKKFKAVDNLNLKIKSHECFGLLGPNGAGKTTTIKMLCGLLYPTSGKIFINQKDFIKNRNLVRKVGIMFSEQMLYNRLTAYQNLKYYSKLLGVKNYKERINDLLNFFELNEWAQQYVESFSLGMRSKLSLCRALLHDPEILLLDEPTLGLDIENATLIRHLLKELNKTIILTTHYINEAEWMCDRIGFLFKGKLIEIDSPVQLKKKLLFSIILEVQTLNNSNLIDELKSKFNTLKIDTVGKKLKITLDNHNMYSDIIKIIGKYNVQSITEKIPKLEKLFLELVKRQKTK